jgi:serine/threonine protein kinase
MQDPLLGKRLREYFILECIGRGGMAKVYKARHVLLDEIRAIKFLRPELSDTSEFIARFRREAQILVRLKNPHLVTLYEFGILGKDLLFMVMEFLEGESLRSRLRRLGWIPVSDSVEIVKQVALGLSAAHRQGVVHRDVSPDNVLMVPQGSEEIAKVIDFGIAKRVMAVGDGKITDTMKFVGKAEYVSPEQIRVPRGGEQVDGRSDVYSLGITMYELLTGAMPFHAKTPQGYIAQHLTAVPRPMIEANPLVAVPPSVEDLVMRMLRKDRSERPASMDELFMELTAVRHQAPVLTPSW